MDERVHIDPVLLWVVLGLTALGVVMVYSASAVLAERDLGDSTYYLRRQLMNAGLGLGLLLLGLYMGYQRFSRLAYPLLLVSVLLLVLVFVPGLSGVGGHSTRWIRLGLMNFQPTELAKVCFVLYLASSLTRKRESIRVFSVGFLPHAVVSGVFGILLLAQPDFGSALTLLLIMFLMLFVAGTRVSFILGAALMALPLAYFLIAGSGYRMRRMLAFLDPWADRYDTGYQITESLMSLGAGGVTGVGLGAGRHKLGYLPAIHTDFIFSQIGEELGLCGAALVVLCFGVIVWRGLRAAFRAPDLFGTYVAFGLTALIGLEALINIGVVTGLLPTKGLTLPLVSYGGSSMICTMFAIGILLDVSAAGQAPQTLGDPKVTWP